MPNTGKLYFDIETTGLSPAASHITVIGAAFYDGNEPVIRQFICEKPTDEKKLLAEFLLFASGFDTLVHFNGRTFDIPYLRKKAAFYHLNDSVSDLHEKDLYRLAGTYSCLFSMPSHKQKDYETVFGFERTDTLSGADCTKEYRDYLVTGEQIHLDRLLLHNKEDLLGMLFIEKRLEGFQALAEGQIDITDIRTETPDSGFEEAAAPSLIIDFEPGSPFHISFEQTFSCSGLPVSIRLKEKAGTIVFPAFKGQLKHFFSDYKNYYYLPVEDRAIHKSVGQFVDAAYREQASRATAYEPYSGIFYPQFSDIIEPAFRFTQDDPVSWFRAEDIKTAAEVCRLVSGAFCAFLSRKI